MKNPLVDALRQANVPPDDASDGPAGQAAQIAVQHRPVDVGELVLLDTLSIDPKAQTANDDLDAHFFEASRSQISDNDDDMQIVLNRSASGKSHHAAAARSGTRGLPKLGRYSPLLGLALLLASAGAYFAYQRMTGNYQNVDLQVLPTQIESLQRADDPVDAASKRFTNPFALIVGPPADAPVAGRPKASTPERRVAAKGAVDAPQVLAAVPDSTFALLHDAYAAFEAGDLAAAEIAYRDALRIAPRHPNALHGLAAVLQRRGLTAESLAFYQALLSVQPDNTAALAVLLTQPGGSATAISEIKYLMQQHAESPSLNFALGVVLAEQTRWVEARHYFDRAVTLDAGNADYLFNLGVSLERLGRFDEARHHYEAALLASNASSAVSDATLLARIMELKR